MTSGLDVWLEKSGAHVSVSHDKQFPSDVNNKKQPENEPEIDVYYLRVNNRGLSWGKQQQIDDNIAITYNKNNGIIIGIDLL